MTDSFKFKKVFIVYQYQKNNIIAVNLLNVIKKPNLKNIAKVTIL